jgi:hypothetical protein
MIERTDDRIIFTLDDGSIFVVEFVGNIVAPPVCTDEQGRSWSRSTGRSGELLAREHAFHKTSLPVDNIVHGTNYFA